MQVIMDTGPWAAFLDRSEGLLKKEKYRDIPMDYADATLFYLAEALSINHVITFDSKHFGIYRLTQKQPFVIFP